MNPTNETNQRACDVMMKMTMNAISANEGARICVSWKVAIHHDDAYACLLKIKIPSMTKSNEPRN